MNRRPLACACLLFLLGLAPAAHAAVDVTELCSEAMLRADVKSLDTLLAPNFLFVASNGHIQDKDHFLASVRSGKLVVKGFTLKNMRESAIGTTRVITGNGTFEASADTPLPSGLMRLGVVVDRSAAPAERIVFIQITPVLPTPQCSDGNCLIR